MGELTPDPRRAACPVDRCDWELNVTLAPGESAGFIRELAQHFDNVFVDARGFILSEHMRQHNAEDYLCTIGRLREELLAAQRQLAQ